MGILTRTGRPSATFIAQARCTCQWSGCAWHDELLRLESDGLDGLGRLVAAWAVEGGDVRSDNIASSAFEAFVADHHWDDPGRIYRLGRNLAETFDRYRREGAGTRTAFEYEVAIVRCKAAALRAEGAAGLADELDQGIGEIVAWVEGRRPV